MKEKNPSGGPGQARKSFIGYILFSYRSEIPKVGLKHVASVSQIKRAGR